MITPIKHWLRRDRAVDHPATANPSAAAGIPIAAEPARDVTVEIAGYLPHITRMSEQLKQTSQQIENAVVDVCNSFEGIAQRSRQTVGRTADFLGTQGESGVPKKSFEGLIENCSDTLLKILSATEEAGEISRRAIERIQQMDEASKKITEAIGQLEQIARGNQMLAMNARIEAAHAGQHGVGFAVVAVEVVSQTEKSQRVTAQVSELIGSLRALAGSTLEDLRGMNEKDRQRVDQARVEVDASLNDLQAAHSDMKQMLTGMSEEGALLANEIGSAIRGMQFQDRTSQRIAHVVEDFDTLHARLAGRFGACGQSAEPAADLGFSEYTMLEERIVAGVGEQEAAGGDVELF